MAQSIKDQMFLKLQAASSALDRAIIRIEYQLRGLTKEQIRDDAELFRLSLELSQLRVQQAGLFKLFSNTSKKQKTRLVLAVCEGQLKDGTPCEYKIRASMSAFLRGVPCCPDKNCSRKSKPFMVQVPDEEDLEARESAEAMMTPEEKIAEAERRREKEKERARVAGLPRFGNGEKPVDVPKVNAPKPEEKPNLNEAAIKRQGFARFADMSDDLEDESKKRDEK